MTKKRIKEIAVKNDILYMFIKNQFYTYNIYILYNNNLIIY